MDKKMLPTISLVVPVYNVEMYLKECLDSIKMQSYDKFEVILVDDGSTDKSGQICDRYAATDSRFRVIHQENLGVCEARNNGVAVARGAWTVFVDSDDLLPSDACEIYVEIAKKTNADVIWGYNHLLQNGCVKPNRIFDSGFLLGDKKQINIFILLMLDWKTSPVKRIGGNINVCWNRAIRTSMIIDNNLKFDSSVGHMTEDMLFNLYVFRAAQSVAYVDKSVYIYRQVASSAANGLMKGGFRWNDALFMAIERFIEDTNSTMLSKDTLYRAYYHVVLERFRRAIENYCFFLDEEKVMRARYMELKENMSKKVYQKAIRTVDPSTLALSTKAYSIALFMKSARLIKVVYCIKRSICKH